MPSLTRPMSGPSPFRIEGRPPEVESRKWIIDLRWFRHLAPRELLPYHSMFDTLYREWLGRELAWEETNGEQFRVRPTEIVGAILQGAKLRVPLGDPLPLIEMMVEVHPDGTEVAKVLPRWLQRTVTPGEILRTLRASADVDPSGLTHLTSHPTLIMEVAKAYPDERRYQDVRNVFIVPAKLLISPKAKLPVTGARPFTVYCHSFGDIDAEAAPNWFYYGITQRPWQERWSEHARAISGGSQLKFYKTFREAASRGQVSFVGHDVVHVGADLDELYDWEEELIEAAWGDPMLLNMIPGGKAGLAYLARHGMLGTRARIAPDERDRIVSEWLGSNPRIGLPAPWVAKRWRNPDWAASFICSGHGRLSVQQVHLIRELGQSGVKHEEIRELSGARTLAQVAGVLSGATYSRVV